MPSSDESEGELTLIFRDVVDTEDASEGVTDKAADTKADSLWDAPSSGPSTAPPVWRAVFQERNMFQSLVDDLGREDILNLPLLSKWFREHTRGLVVNLQTLPRAADHDCVEHALQVQRAGPRTRVVLMCGVQLQEKPVASIAAAKQVAVAAQERAEKVAQRPKSILTLVARACWLAQHWNFGKSNISAVDLSCIHVLNRHRKAREGNPMRSIRFPPNVNRDCGLWRFRSSVKNLLELDIRDMSPTKAKTLTSLFDNRPMRRLLMNTNDGVWKLLASMNKEDLTGLVLEDDGTTPPSPPVSISVPRLQELQLSCLYITPNNSHFQALVCRSTLRHLALTRCQFPRRTFLDLTRHCPLLEVLDLSDSSFDSCPDDFATLSSECPLLRVVRWPKLDPIKRMWLTVERLAPLLHLEELGGLPVTRSLVEHFAETHPSLVYMEFAFQQFIDMQKELKIWSRVFHSCPNFTYLHVSEANYRNQTWRDALVKLNPKLKIMFLA